VAAAGPVAIVKATLTLRRDTVTKVTSACVQAVAPDAPQDTPAFAAISSLKLTCAAVSKLARSTPSIVTTPLTAVVPLPAVVAELEGLSVGRLVGGDAVGDPVEPGARVGAGVDGVGEVGVGGVLEQLVARDSAVSSTAAKSFCVFVFIENLQYTFQAPQLS